MTLSVVVEQWTPEQSAAYVMDAWQKAVESIIETGRRLLEVRARTRHGGWDDVVALLPFSDRTIRMLMAVARHPVLSNRKHVSDLPASWGTLYKLSRVADLEERLATGEVTADLQRKDVDSWLKDQAKNAYLARQTIWHNQANMTGERWEIRQGDFRDVLPDFAGNVDAVVTDPPYGDEYLHLWDALGEVSNRILRVGAPLLAWSGQLRLRAVLEALENHLRYGWTISLDMPGVNSRVHYVKMMQSWKPIMVFTAGAWGPHDWHPDQVTSPAKDQALYEWQQNSLPAAELIDRYVSPGGLVVDPFCGVGSFGIAALQTGRRFLGVELDAPRAAMAAARLAEVEA